MLQAESATRFLLLSNRMNGFANIRDNFGPAEGH
jgi:hypothetical protein